HIVLCISGEPLLNPSFCKMVTLAKKAGLAVYLSTNATVLSPSLSKKLLCAGLDWINFSFDGCDKETYENIRRGADFDKTLQNIIGFLKIKKALGAKTRTELQILVMDEKGRRSLKSNLSSFKNRFLGLPLDCLQVRTPSTWGKFFLKTKKFSPKKPGRRFSPCSYLWGSLHLLFDGRVVACTSDFFGENVLGKFPEKSLVEIWNDKPMQNFRRAMLRIEYFRFNKNCEGCDSLWERPILGLPAGLRGICASSFSSVFGQGFMGIFKRVAKLVNRNFSMEVIGD
ncbi:MAG: SPASM domain-containing protein, partial [bacterium]|nr:SPASM domain-containing protein [bacterium]